MKDAAGIDPRDRAAAGADAGDIERIKRDAMAAYPAVHGERRRAVDNQADIGRGAAHVEGDQVTLGHEPGGVDAAGDPAGRPRQHPADGEPARLGDRRDPAMRLDDQNRAAIARRAEPLLQSCEVARQHGPDIGVDDRRRDPLEFLDLRQDLGG